MEPKRTSPGCVGLVIFGVFIFFVMPFLPLLKGLIVPATIFAIIYFFVKSWQTMRKNRKETPNPLDFNWTPSPEEKGSHTLGAPPPAQGVPPATPPWPTKPQEGAPPATPPWPTKPQEVAPPATPPWPTKPQEAVPPLSAPPPWPAKPQEVAPPATPSWPTKPQEVAPPATPSWPTKPQEVVPPATPSWPTKPQEVAPPATPPWPTKPQEVAPPATSSWPIVEQGQPPHGGEGLAKKGSKEPIRSLHSVLSQREQQLDEPVKESLTVNPYTAKEATKNEDYKQLFEVPKLATWEEAIAAQKTSTKPLFNTPPSIFDSPEGLKDFSIFGDSIFNTRKEKEEDTEKKDK